MSRQSTAPDNAHTQKQQQKHRTQRTDTKGQGRQQQRDDGYRKCEKVAKEDRNDRKKRDNRVTEDEGKTELGEPSKARKEKKNNTFKNVCWVGVSDKCDVVAM